MKTYENYTIPITCKSAFGNECIFFKERGDVYKMGYCLLYSRYTHNENIKDHDGHLIKPEFCQKKTLKANIRWRRTGFSDAGG